MASQKKGGWGSVFSGAVANLESRLDTILANEPEPAVTREAARTRVNDRLAERLARATAQKSLSRISTPANDAHSARASGELKRSLDLSRPDTANGVQSSPKISTRASVDEQRLEAEGEASDNDAAEASFPEAGPLLTSRLPINPARISLDSSRPSVETTGDAVSSRQSLELANDSALVGTDTAEMQARMDRMQSEHTQAEIQRQDEMHIYLERIDALQAKLTYLAKETVAAAKEANASSEAGEWEKSVAEKDERIALLMEEGERLSKSEMHYLQTIKKLRAKNIEDGKTVSEMKRRLDRLERTEADLKSRVRRAEVAERQAMERAKNIAVIEKQVDELREDRENAAELVRSLTMQLGEAKEKAGRAQEEALSKASEINQATIASLRNELEDAQIEKRLAEDRAAAETEKIQGAAENQKERFGVREFELKNEIAGLESRLEAMRARAEEASASSDVAGIEGESSIKLLRQVETLQRQYSLAKGNWEVIETSLNTRVVALENERDEAMRREAEVRKKVRDAAVQARRLEEELEAALEQTKSLDRELKTRIEQYTDLQSRFDQAGPSESDSKAEVEKQRKAWEAELILRIEDEKVRWRREMGGMSPVMRTESPSLGRRGSPVIDAASKHMRRPTGRLTSYDISPLQTDSRSHNRRSSAVPPLGSSQQMYVNPTDASPSISRRESGLSHEEQSVPPTPSIEVEDDPIEDFEEIASPQPTLGDLFSTSTAGPGVGPSVQLVERMSAHIRKLESEKASFKDELGRLGAQRDDSRNQVVELMREVEVKRNRDAKLSTLELELDDLKGRYNASLEMLGEREEEVEELKLDVKELKTIYRELVEAKVGHTPE